MIRAFLWLPMLNFNRLNKLTPFIVCLNNALMKSLTHETRDKMTILIACKKDLLVYLNELIEFELGRLPLKLEFD